MIKRLCLAFSFLLVSLAADEDFRLSDDLLSDLNYGKGYERYAPKFPEPQIVPPPPGACEDDCTPNPCGDQTVIMDELRGVLLYEDEQPENWQLEDGVHAFGMKMRKRDLARVRCALKEYLGRPLRVGDLPGIKRAILGFYKTMKRPLVLVQIPEQEIVRGVLRIKITQARLGKLCVDGAKYFCPDVYLRAIRACEGDIICNQTLTDDILWINRNTFRQASVIYSPGQEVGTTDVTILAEEHRPIRVYVGADNTGYKETEEARLFTGFNWGNAFGKGHTMSYQFTTAPEPEKFHAHSGYYSAPLPWRHQVDLFGGWSRVFAPDVGQGFSSTGFSYQGSIRYVVPLRSYGRYHHEMRFGISAKRTNNNLDFGETQIIKKPLHLTQFSFGYQFSYNYDCYRNQFEIDFYSPPGGHLGTSSDARFQELRYAAKNSYIYLLAKYTQLTFFGNGYSLQTRLAAQYASENLLPSEQYGLGGLYSVRGYRERVENRDNAFEANVEFVFPALHMTKRKMDRLNFLTFVDFAIGADHQRQKGENGTVTLVSVGPGMRYYWRDNLSLVAYYGIKKKVGDDQERGRFNLSGTLSF